MHNYQYTQDLPFSKPPLRVVSLVPSITESLIELGMGDRLVGRTEYCIYPVGRVEHIPAVGGTKNPNLKAIYALAPNVVIMNEEENRLEDAEALRGMGLTVWATFPRTVREALNLLWTIMYAFETPTFSESVRQIERLCDLLEVIEQPEPCRVFVPIWNKPLMTINGSTYVHDLLRVCGGINIFAEHEARYPTVSLAEVEAAQPDVILLPSEPFPFAEQHRALFDGLAVPAVEQGRLVLMDGSLLTWHGTRIARALLTVPNLLYPQQAG